MHLSHPPIPNTAWSFMPSGNTAVETSDKRPNMASDGQSWSTSSSPQRVTQNTTRPFKTTSPHSNNPYGDNIRSASAISTSSRASIESSIVASTTTAVKCEVMIQYLHQRQIEKLWTDGSVTEGVVLKRAKNDFVCQPQELSQQVFGFFDETRKLNVKVRHSQRFSG